MLSSTNRGSDGQDEYSHRLPDGTRFIAGPGSAFRKVVQGDSVHLLTGHHANIAQAAAPESAAVIGFAQIVFEPSLVTALVDRYGSTPLYCSRTDDAWLLSPSLSWLTARIGATRLCEEALGELLTFKFILGDKTLYRDVRRLPPASIQCWDRNCAPVPVVYWRPIPTSRQQPLAKVEDELVAAFSHAVETSVAAKKIAISLSGGLDSRAIVAAAVDSARCLVTLTDGIVGGTDHRFASRVAAAVTERRVLALLDESYRTHFLDYTNEALRRYEGMLLTSGSETLWMIEKSKGFDYEVVLHGALGELAKIETANHFAVERSSLGAFAADPAGYLVRPYERAHAAMLELLDPDLAHNLRGLALTTLRAQVVGLVQETSALNASVALQVGEHFRNSGVYSAKIWEKRCPVEFPFANPAYVDLLLSTLPEDRLGSEFHRTLITKLSPTLAAINESNSGAPVTAGVWHRNLSTLVLRIQQKLGLARAADHTDFSAWMNALPEPIDKVLLDENEAGTTMWNRATVTRLARDCAHGNQRAAGTLYRALCVQRLVTKNSQ